MLICLQGMWKAPAMAGLHCHQLRAHQSVCRRWITCRPLATGLHRDQGRLLPTSSLCPSACKPFPRYLQVCVNCDYGTHWVVGAVMAATSQILHRTSSLVYSLQRCNVYHRPRFLTNFEALH